MKASSRGAACSVQLGHAPAMARHTAPAIRPSPVEAAILALLAERAAEATICPSEVARRLDPVAWRTRMDEVRDAAAALVAAGRVQILQRGKPVSGVTRGPIRIGHARAENAGPLLTPDGRYIVVKVQAAKVALGERGPVWWTDGAPDENRHMAKNTRYADWFAAVSHDDS